MEDNLPNRGDRTDRPSLSDLAPSDDPPPIGETDDVVRMTVRVRKEIRQKLGILKAKTDKNIEDLVDEALRKYVKEE
jgi:hypothetical protein